jgi:hypothetical protein
MDAAVKEIEEENAKTARINTYAETDVMLQIYINRVLLLIYAVLYLLLLLSLYIHRGESSLIISIIVALFFLAYPFFVDFIGQNVTNMFITLKNAVYSGNALFMYKPKTTATY